MSTSPLVAIVLINWNGITDTLACLESLAAVRYPNLLTLVVDNGSANGEAEAIQSAYPGVAVIALGRNLGFTGGNNAGIRHALERGADYVLCLNNDTTVAPDFLTHLVRAMEDDPKIGIATSSIYYYSEPERIACLGVRLQLDALPVAVHINDPAELAVDEKGMAAAVPAVDGCVFMMRRAVAEQTGGFDDAFFIYAEDADLCLRARAQGWRIVVVPDARVWHKIGTSMGGPNSLSSNYYFARNSARVVRLHGTPEQRRRFFPNYRALLSVAWRQFLIDGLNNRQIWRDAQRCRQLADSTVIISQGLLGCSGPRRRWRFLESALRSGVAAQIFLIRLGFPAFYRLYGRLMRLRSSSGGRRLRRKEP